MTMHTACRLVPSPALDGRRPRPTPGFQSVQAQAGESSAALEQLDRLARHDGRDRMLVDKLRMTIAPEQETEIVEPGDDALQFDAIDQEDGQRDVLALRT